MTKLKKYVSFSLWGDKTLYTIGAIRNAELMKQIYPNWNMIVYYDANVPKHVLFELEKNGVELVPILNKTIHPLFWRFFVIDRADCDRAIFRDADSRVSVREKKAVDDWIQENTVLHVMRDHPYHEIPFGTQKLGILGGMWGMKGSEIKIMERISNFVETKHQQEYGIDQVFLESIYEEFKENRTIHDEFFEGKKFPIKREGFRFVGERIDENEKPFGEDWVEIKKFYKKKYKGVKGFFQKMLNK